MGAQEIISVSLAAMELLMKAMTAANAGDLPRAQANLQAAREHYAKAGAAWDAAGNPNA